MGWMTPGGRVVSWVVMGCLLSAKVCGTLGAETSEQQAPGVAVAGLQARIHIEEVAYRPEDRIMLAMTVTNVSDRTIILDSWQIMMSYAVVIWNTNGAVPCTERWLSNALPRDRSQSVSLDAGEAWSHEFRALWDQSCHYRLAPGVYMLKASVSAGPMDDDYGYGEWQGQLTSNALQLTIVQ